MARKPRIQYPGAIHHILSPGNYRKDLFIVAQTGLQFEKAFFGDYGGGLASEYIGGGLIVSAILGGTASEIGGGKFSNGALSGAMTFVLSTAIHQEPSQSEKAQATSLGSKSELGNALRKIPILGGILGGVGDILSGAGNVALDKFNQGFSQIGGGFSRTIGSIWALPNSIVGLAYGAIGIPFGAKLHWDSNNTILQVTNHPFMLGAMSLGDVNVFGRLVPPSTMGPFGFTVGQEEALHSIQSRILGPLYFPAHILGGIKSWFTPPGKAPYPGLDFWHRNNFMENGPMNGRVF